PGEAHEGDLISILGDKFGENETGAGVVTFDGDLEAEIISWSSSAIVCQVPEGAETGNILVTTPEGISNGIQITILVTYYDEELVEHRFLGDGTPMGWHADDRSWEYVLPFSFPFFAHDHDTVHVCSNGFLVFDDDGFSSYDNESEVFKTKVMIAPLWDDLVTTGSSGEDIYIHSPSPDSVSFRWAGKRYGNTDPINVEAILHKDGRIEFNYGSGNADLSPTIGISSGEGSEYHLSLYDGSSLLEKAETVLYTPLGFSAAGTEYEESGGGDGGNRCFIATAAFGSPWERHVCILRTFRDRYLQTSCLGRFFVRTYETWSPPLARFIREHEPARSVVRVMLLPWVAVAYAVCYFRVKVAIAVLAFIFMTCGFRSFVRKKDPVSS
ncbi:MAG: IPT/TIG domain-containing protein, partial [Deltaproteobacteria bacterium]|nr:IPT/TIG domain-containing protein [Deltaproteobacteria bacterium]